MPDPKVDIAAINPWMLRMAGEVADGDVAGMAAQITDDHIATFCTEATWDSLATALVDKYAGVATGIVFYNAMMSHPERLQRFGEIAHEIHFLSAARAD